MTPTPSILSSLVCSAVNLVLEKTDAPLKLVCLLFYNSNFEPLPLKLFVYFSQFVFNIIISPTV